MIQMHWRIYFKKRLPKNFRRLTGVVTNPLFPHPSFTRSLTLVRERIQFNAEPIVGTCAWPTQLRARESIFDKPKFPILGTLRPSPLANSPISSHPKVAYPHLQSGTTFSFFDYTNQHLRPIPKNTCLALTKSSACPLNGVEVSQRNTSMGPASLTSTTWMGLFLWRNLGDTAVGASCSGEFRYITLSLISANCSSPLLLKFSSLSSV